MSWWWPFFKIEPNAERPPERAECTTGHPGYCRAWRWSACTGGRCKNHCDMYCRCVPVGAPGELTVIEGGRKA